MSVYCWGNPLTMVDKDRKIYIKMLDNMRKHPEYYGGVEK